MCLSAWSPLEERGGLCGVAPSLSHDIFTYVNDR
jgi:hypothetical protein